MYCRMADADQINVSSSTRGQLTHSRRKRVDDAGVIFDSVYEHIDQRILALKLTLAQDNAVPISSCGDFPRFNGDFFRGSTLTPIVPRAKDAPLEISRF